MLVLGEDYFWSSPKIEEKSYQSLMKAKLVLIESSSVDKESQYANGHFFQP